VSIYVLGNEKTKEHIILRESGLKSGDSIDYSSVDSIRKVMQDRIFNLALFIQVKVVFDSVSESEKVCKIEVYERFFTIPGFNIELADRTFNEWWFVYNHKLSRLQYGISVVQKNCFGRNHTLSAIFQTGFSDYLNLSYQIPYFTANEKMGLNLSFQFLSNHELAYGISDSNRLIYTRNDTLLRNRSRFDAEFSFRNNAFFHQFFTLSFHTNNISDHVYSLNEHYLLKYNKAVNLISFSYLVDFNKTDIHFYPLKGMQIVADLSYYRALANTNFGQLNYNAYLAKYYSYGKNIYSAHSLQFFGTISPYFSYLFSPSLGYSGVFIRSYEYYLVKGNTISLVKNEAKYKLIDKWFLIKFLPLNKFNKVPLQIYPKIYIDAAYVADNRLFVNYYLNNTLLIGTGAGIDIVSYYDIVVRIEAGLNLLKEKSLFFHLNKGI